LCQEHLPLLNNFKNLRVLSLPDSDAFGIAFYWSLGFLMHPGTWGEETYALAQLMNAIQKDVTSLPNSTLRVVHVGSYVFKIGQDGVFKKVH
jgi:predicted Kef-type K+ transport protein